MRLICVHPRFASLSSHHYNESLGLQRECARRGVPFVLLMSTQASAELAAPFAGRRVIDDPTFRMEWSYAERVDRFAAQMHALLDDEVRGDDRVLITVATQVEALALVRWLRALPPERKPWLPILILSDRWNRSTRDEYERQMREYAVLRAELAALAPADARRVMFFTLTDKLAAELREMLGMAVQVAPIPLEYGVADAYAGAAPPHAQPCVAVLGGLRREKGSYLLPEIVRACRGRVAVDFLVQLFNNALTPAEMAHVETVAAEPNVRVLRAALSAEAYNAALLEADIGLFPYEVIPYFKRNSGVMAELVAYGKPVIATAGTWMAEQIAQGRAAGCVFERLDPDCIADAIARAIARLPALRAAAAPLASQWREGSGIAGFVARIEATIAARAAA